MKFKELYHFFHGLLVNHSKSRVTVYYLLVNCYIRLCNLFILLIHELRVNYNMWFQVY